jgi:hypothetical protein
MYEQNTITDGMSTLNNVMYQFNNSTGMLDVTTFDGLYNSNDDTLVSNLSRIGSVKKNPFKTLRFV